MGSMRGRKPGVQEEEAFPPVTGQLVGTAASGKFPFSVLPPRR